MKEPREISETNGAGDINANFLSSASKFLGNVAERVFDISEKTGGFVEKELAGWSDPNKASGALKQRNSKTVFDTLHLAGDGALSEAGDLGGFCKAAVFHNQMEEGKFIEIEWNGAEKLIHLRH